MTGIFAVTCSSQCTEITSRSLPAAQAAAPLHVPCNVRQSPAALQKFASRARSANSPQPTLRRLRSENTGTAVAAPRQGCCLSKGPSFWTMRLGELPPAHEKGQL